MGQQHIYYPSTGPHKDLKTEFSYLCSGNDGVSCGGLKIWALIKQCDYTTGQWNTIWDDSVFTYPVGTCGDTWNNTNPPPGDSISAVTGKYYGLTPGRYTVKLTTINDSGNVIDQYNLCILDGTIEDEGCGGILCNCPMNGS